MKTILLKTTTIIFCLLGLISPKLTAQITAYGSYVITDNNHPTATFTVYAVIEYDGTPYPCTNPGNPFTTTAPVGTNNPTLIFGTVPVPNPPPDRPYRLVLRADRNANPPFWGAQTQYGYSDWLNATDFQPWSPNPIRIAQFTY
jgi:hypothetical protein